MKEYTANNIINLAIAGHSGSGKTSITEAMLRLSGAITRLGKINDGTTVSDFDAEEQKRKISINTSIAPVIWNNKKINVLDTPGLFDFAGAAAEAVRAADSMLITVSGKSGVQVGTEKAVQMADKMKLSKAFFVNGLCDESARFYRVFEDLKAKFGPAVCPVVVPFIENGKADIYINILEYKAYNYSNGAPVEVKMPDMGDRLEGLRTAIYEAVAESSETMFEKYFSGEKFTPEEVIVGISKGVKSGSVIPVFCGDAVSMRGMEQFLNGLVWLLPSAQDKISEMGTTDTGDIEEIKTSNGVTTGFCFKTLADPFVGKLSFIKVICGELKTDMQVINSTTDTTIKIGKIVTMMGKKQIETDSIGAGDIGAVIKLNGVHTGDTLCSSLRKVRLEPIIYPNASLTAAILPKEKGEEDKIAQGILKLMEEDPSIHLKNNTETHEMIISVLGEQQLDCIISRLKTRYGVEAVAQSPKIAYREKIQKKVKVQGKYKKQTGGHGQYGDVWIQFEPNDSDDMVFDEKVVGGSVPKGYFPAVEKGLRECILKGTLAGYPVVGLKATLYDGSYHPVDSSEMAFKMAAAAAFKAGIPKAEPVLLEPVGVLKATVPDSNMGDIMGEINKRRGRVIGMQPADIENYQIINAEIPEGEMTDFSTFIRQSTQGRGEFTFKFDHYENCPPAVAKKIIQK